MPALYTRFCRFYRQSSGHSVQFGLLPRRKHAAAPPRLPSTTSTSPFNKVATALCPFSPDFQIHDCSMPSPMAWFRRDKSEAAVATLHQRSVTRSDTCLSPLPSTGMTRESCFYSFPCFGSIRASAAYGFIGHVLGWN